MESIFHIRPFLRSQKSLFLTQNNWTFVSNGNLTIFFYQTCENSTNTDMFYNFLYVFW